jgi:hypothetical protein
MQTFNFKSANISLCIRKQKEGNKINIENEVEVWILL